MRFWKPSWTQVVVGLCCGVLGFGAVTQARLAGSSDAYAGLRPAELVEVLTSLNAQAQRAEQEVNRLRASQRKLRSSGRRRQEAFAQARSQEATLGILAGTTPTHGPGLRITVRLAGSASVLNLVLNCVEELRDAGAEAIELNDSVRVVAQSSFDTGAGGLLVGGRTLGSPYVIDVIGNPDTLNKALTFAGGFISQVRAAGGSVEVLRRGDVRITAVVADSPARYATSSSGQ